MIFIKKMKNEIFKILPLKEETNAGLYDYIDSVSVQLNGALYTYPFLSEDSDYVAVLNIINYLKRNKFNVKQCKREVFKCLEILNKVYEKYE